MRYSVLYLIFLLSTILGACLTLSLSHSLIGYALAFQERLLLALGARVICDGSSGQDGDASWVIFGDRDTLPSGG